MDEEGALVDQHGRVLGSVFVYECVCVCVFVHQKFLRVCLIEEGVNGGRQCRLKQALEHARYSPWLRPRKEAAYHGHGIVCGCSRCREQQGVWVDGQAPLKGVRECICMLTWMSLCRCVDMYVRQTACAQALWTGISSTRATTRSWGRERWCKCYMRVGVRMGSIGLSSHHRNKRR